MAPKNRLQLQKATVEKFAESTSATASANVPSAYIERVKKCFARAKHANANESEAQAAMRMASKIM